MPTKTFVSAEEYRQHLTTATFIEATNISSKHYKAAQKEAASHKKTQEHMNTSANLTHVSVHLRTLLHSEHQIGPLLPQP